MLIVILKGCFFFYKDFMAFLEGGAPGIPDGAVLCCAGTCHACQEVWRH